MTEQSAAAEPCAEPTPEVTKEQKVANIKEALQMGLRQNYLTLVNYLAKMQGHPQLKMHCLMNLDQAMFWGEQFVESIQIHVTDSPANVTPITPDTSGVNCEVV
jgi:hypothetical protein